MDHQGKGSRPLVIGITGGSGSGKTSFLHQLKKSFTESELCVFSTDNYYRDKEDQQLDNLGFANYDLPTALHRKELHRDVKKLIAGQEVERQEYTFNNPNRKARDLVFKPAKVLILEGIFVFHFEEVAELIDLKAFLYTSESTALARRIRRDRIERNYPLEDVLYRYEKHVLPTYRKYIEPVREQADVLINNNQHFGIGLEVMTGYLKDYLAGLK